MRLYRVVDRLDKNGTIKIQVINYKTKKRYEKIYFIFYTVILLIDCRMC